MQEKKETKNINKQKINEESWLIPAIIQDFHTGEVLMLAYMNRESFIKSIVTKTTWFWSRSRKELWNKGQTSGNIQLIKEIRYDCDSDALLFKVEQKGFACHTGARSCFFNIIETREDNINLKVADSVSKKLTFSYYKSPDTDVLEELYSVIVQRFEEMDEKSYTFRLHKAGIDEILKKLGEESIEIILSAKHQGAERLISEISDLVYHLLVLMAETKINLSDVRKELESRRR